ncbi:3-methyladenine DNA glycosylase [Halarcobacter ebronensis]|uniref:3-methyladenine DNA glycosylase n=1 Tax=Halarcobacter ebronensis TaxID=1462615 RepID=A0A4Q0YET4_9BACT|nr:3-methyladenine DNA glycosylase [Halarcobacter ebronensis]
MQLSNEISNSYELLEFLKKQNLLKEEPSYWWPSSSDFEILIGAILTQNTKWTNVEKSLENLKRLNIFSLENFLKIDLTLLTEAIAPSGFKNQKSQRLKLLAKNILEEFGSFDNFCQRVNREWLLEQKGIGFETADAILCYACHQEFMVVDKYTQKLVSYMGFEFETYEDLQAWCEYGINENLDKIFELYGYEISLNKLYCRFHGKIIEFMKSNRLKARVKE